MIECPFGEKLNFKPNNAVFLAGGSGITPFMSAIRYVVAKKLNSRIILIYSNKSVNDIIFKEELERINKSKESIKVVNTLTASIPDDWDQETGRITKEMILKHVKRPEQWTFYVCGPPGMVASLRSALKEIGISEENVKTED